MKKITQILAFALVLGVSLYACDTKKDPAPVVVPPPVTGFTAAQVAGTWKLTAGAASAVGVPDIFDPAGLSAGNADGRKAFCTKNSTLVLKADGTFTEDFLAGTYIFPGQADQTCTASSLAGTFAVVAVSGSLTLTYTGGTPAPPRSFVVKTVTATTMTIEITTTVPFTVVTTVTYTKQ